MSVQIKVISAQLSHDTEMFSNMDPYCIVELGGRRQRTATLQEAGKKPVWNRIFKFNTTDNLMKLTVMDQDLTSDDLVGSGQLNIANSRNSVTEVQQIVQLYYKGRSAGKILVSVCNGGGGQINNNVWGNNQNQWNNTQQQFGNQWNQQQQWGNQQQQQWGNQQQQWGVQQNNNFGQPQNPYQSPKNPYVPQNPYQQPNQMGGQNANNNGMWGNINQNNGWGNFVPQAPQTNQGGNLYPQINSPPTNNPLNLLTGYLVSNQGMQQQQNVQVPPPQAPQNNQNLNLGYQMVTGMGGLLNNPQVPYTTNPYATNSYK